MVCALAHSPDEVIDEVRFPTTDGDETLRRVKEYFVSAQEKYGELGSIGYGTFGPAGVSLGNDDYGKILKTPKPGWEGVDVMGFLKNAFPKVAMAFDTDVNAAAMGEGALGAARGVKNYVYITVGTGIGGGVVVNGRPLHAKPHAEIGHMLVPHIDDYAGCCSFHGACLEGLASGSAIGGRWGVSAVELPPEHQAWDLESSYLAMMVQNLVASFAPEQIILGGGVMEQKFLLRKVWEKFQKSQAGYWSYDESFLVNPALGNQAGIVGALVMAEGVIDSIDLKVV